MMRTVKVLVDGHRQGVVPVHSIELAYVIHQGSYWQVKMHLSSGLNVTSFSYDDRAQAEAALRKLFHEDV